jgi:hypothetical protein
VPPSWSGGAPPTGPVPPVVPPAPVVAAPPEPPVEDFEPPDAVGPASFEEQEKPATRASVPTPSDRRRKGRFLGTLAEDAIRGLVPMYMADKPSFTLTLFIERRPDPLFRFRSPFDAA